MLQALSEFKANEREPVSKQTNKQTKKVNGSYGTTSEFIPWFHMLVHTQTYTPPHTHEKINLGG